MTFTLQLVLTTEDGQQEVRQIASVARSDLWPETLGLTLAEAKTMLKDLQQLLVERQTSAHLASEQRCPDCDQWRPIKGYHDLALRTLFSKLTIKSPRLHHCPCRPDQAKTFSPLAELLPEHTIIFQQRYEKRHGKCTLGQSWDRFGAYFRAGPEGRWGSHSPVAVDFTTNTDRQVIGKCCNFSRLA